MIINSLIFLCLAVCFYLSFEFMSNLELIPTKMIKGMTGMFDKKTKFFYQRSRFLIFAGSLLMV